GIFIFVWAATLILEVGNLWHNIIYLQPAGQAKNNPYKTQKYSDRRSLSLYFWDCLFCVSH
ncbi:MAG: hypothetical protein ACK5L4_22270, partial [Pseudanabaena sp.]